MTTKTLGQVLYEADNIGRERYMKPYDTLCESTRQEFEASASAVAAVVREQCAQAESQAGQREPLAWMRRWAYDGETPKRERQENGRMAWPLRFKLLPVTKHKVCATDVPLYTLHSIN